MSEDDPAGCRRRLAGEVAATRWQDLRWVAETGSTNADLVALARQGHRQPTVLVADHQTGGRGRLDRRWESPAGANLLVSILVRPPGSPSAWGLVSAAVALAAADACQAADVAAGIKWPNDLVVAGDKVAGLLAEAVTSMETLVVGIGINVAWPLDDDPVPGATSLRAAGSDLDRVGLLGDILRRLDQHLHELESAGPQRVLAAYRDRCLTLGARVRVQLVGGDEIQGTAVDVDDGGALIVMEGERRRVVTVGDVHHLRPAG